VAKLTQLSNNEVLAPIIGAQSSSLDFRRIVAEKRICVIDLDLPGIGEEDAKILGGLLFSRLTAHLHVLAKQARPGDRIPLRVYLDEVQTYADDSLARSMSQMRKFGMCYTLACQHFAQLDGRGWRPDVGRDILANAGSVILFRLGYFDAHMLEPYMAPAMRAADLMRTPNFKAAARLIGERGEPIDPFMFATDPPL
jgi:type IV secretory pathway TraG/TraD family ATPase VirD4